MKLKINIKINHFKLKPNNVYEDEINTLKDSEKTRTTLIKKAKDSFLDKETM